MKGEQPAPHRPDDPAQVPRRGAHDVDLHDRSKWEGPTYYGRSQLKASPFNAWVVGGYVALAGLSGTAALIAAVADGVEGQRASSTVRRGRYLSLLAPVIGSVLLIWGPAYAEAVLQHVPGSQGDVTDVDRDVDPDSVQRRRIRDCGIAASFGPVPEARLGRGRLARVTQIPAAVAGAGLGTYTAALLSATSTPLLAAAPRLMAARFASSSVMAGASALSLGEGSARRRRRLDALTPGSALGGVGGHGRFPQNVFEARCGWRAGRTLGASGADCGHRPLHDVTNRTAGGVTGDGETAAGYAVRHGMPRVDRRQFCCFASR